MATDDQVRLYEGLFLLSQEAASNDFGGCVDFLRATFDRAKAEVVVLRRWDERRLAAEIKRQKRGVFLLAYFKCEPSQIAAIERSCALSEQVLRCLIIRADHIGEVELEAAAKDAELSIQMKLDEQAEPAEDRTTDAPPAKVEPTVPEPKAEPTVEVTPPEPVAEVASPEPEAEAVSPEPVAEAVSPEPAAEEPEKPVEPA